LNKLTGGNLFKVCPLDCSMDKKKIAKKKAPVKTVVRACSYNSNCSSPAYGLGVLGAAIYYVSTATSFWMGVLGLLKAIVWPAFLVFEVLKFLAA